MADVLTLDGGTPGVNKTFSLSTTNTLFGTSRFLNNRLLSTYGQFFTPNRVTICYTPYTRITAFNNTVSVNGGKAVYYNPNTVITNATHKQNPVYESDINISLMPAWLSALVLPYV